MVSCTALIRNAVAAMTMFTLLSLASSVSLADEQTDNVPPYVGAADLANVIRTKNVDHILDVLAQVKQMRYRGEVLPYLLDLWNLRQDKYRDLPWDIVSLDIVRLDIGNVLAQANRNGLIKVDSDAIHDFALGLIHSVDVDVAGNALWTLSIFDREQDVSEIKRVALTTPGKPFYLAVLALSDMCNASAAGALKDLESADLTREQVDFVAKRIEQSADFKKRTGSCRASN